MVAALLPAVSDQNWRLRPIIVHGTRDFGRDQSTTIERIGIADLSLSRRLGRLREAGDGAVELTALAGTLQTYRVLKTDRALDVRQLLDQARLLLHLNQPAVNLLRPRLELYLLRC